MGSDVLYAIFGGTLSFLLAAIILFYYRSHRKDRIEGPKHKMLEDDDDA